MYVVYIPPPFFFIASSKSCSYFSYSIYRQTGKQIQGVIRSAYKIERQAGGMQIFSLKYLLRLSTFNLCR